MTRTLGTGGDPRLLGTDGDGSLVLRRMRLRIARGPDRGVERLLGEESLVIGSGPTADLVLRDPKVSRVHVELALMDTGLRVRDLGSRNGTHVGEMRVESVVVQPGTSIRIGETRIDLETADVPVEAPPERARLGLLVAESVSMRRILGLLERVAPTDVPVLLEGEAGVGKTEAAHALHHASGRAQAPLVVLDMSVRPSREQIRAAFDSAYGGTLLIEQVDHSGARAEAAMVRELDPRDRGSLDVRTIATSREDLRALARGGALRDLYHRLAGVHVRIPPLRERREDVRALVRHLAASRGARGMQVSESDVAVLRDHPLPGNVRQLGHLIEAALGGAPGRSGEGRRGYKEEKERLIDAFEAEYMRDLLERHRGNLTRAAAEAGLGRNHFLELARRHGVR